MSDLALFVRFFSIICFVTLNAFGDIFTVTQAQHFRSPSGNLVAHLSYKDDGWCYMSIENTKTGAVDESQKVELTPVFAITWTGDSKTIVAVGHIEHGSIATLFHLTKGGWESSIVNPPDAPMGDRVTEDVVGLSAGKEDVRLAYIMTIDSRLEDGSSTHETYKMSFEINPETHHIGKMKKDSNYLMLPGAEDWNGTIPRVNQ